MIIFVLYKCKRHFPWKCPFLHSFGSYLTDIELLLALMDWKTLNLTQNKPWISLKGLIFTLEPFKFQTKILSNNDILFQKKKESSKEIQFRDRSTKIFLFVFWFKWKLLNMPSRLTNLYIGPAYPVTEWLMCGQLELYRLILWS